MYKNNKVEIVQKQVLLACSQDVTFRSCHNEQGAAYHHVNSKRFGNVEATKIQQIKRSGKRERLLK